MTKRGHNKYNYNYYCQGMSLLAQRAYQRRLQIQRACNIIDWDATLNIMMVFLLANCNAALVSSTINVSNRKSPHNLRWSRE
mmetsp:Transcript_20776/g.31734  ORF Transcript_20776/g.31734 Transcript_20776/m.31734 type:complete len:82 (+) Transcript_20776:214-459(+)